MDIETIAAIAVALPVLTLMAVWAALTFDPTAYQIAIQYEQIQWISNSVLIFAGLSIAFSQSVILFVNNVPASRFILRISMAAVVFFGSFFIWVLGTWLLLDVVFGIDVSLSGAFRAIAIGQAPFVFMFFSVIPYLGNFISRLIYMYALFTTAFSIAVTFDIAFWQGAIAGLLGWFLIYGLNSLLGNPGHRIETWIYRKTTGRKTMYSIDAAVQKARDRLRAKLRGDTSSVPAQ